MPGGRPLTADELAEIDAIGDNTGCMALKGGSPSHEGDAAGRRLAVGRRACARRPQRWGIIPERDLVMSG